MSLLSSEKKSVKKTKPVPKQASEDKLNLPTAVYLDRMPIDRINHSKNTISKNKVANSKSAVKNYVGELNPKFFQKVIVQMTRCKKLEDALKKDPRIPSLKKAPSIPPKKTVKFGKALRKQPAKNYAEVSLDTSRTPAKLQDGNQDHIPIYFQRVPEVVASKKARDPFEFVDTTPKKKKRRKLSKDADADSTSSFVYDKSTQAILRKIRQKEDKSNKQRRPEDTNNIKLPIKNKQGKREVKNAVNLQLVKNDTKKAAVERPQKNHNFNVNNFKKVPNNDTLRELNNKISYTAKRTSEISRRCTCYFEGKDEECSVYFGFDDDDKFSDIFQKVSTKVPALDNTKPVSRNFISMTSTPIPKPSTRNPNKRIHIISNILVSPPAPRKLFDTSSVLSLSSEESKSGGFKGFGQTELTSQNITPLDESANTEKTAEAGFLGFTVKKPSRRKSCPWRLDGFVARRNPYFLEMKDTSLPCYNQDTIFNPQLLEQSEVRRAEAQQNKIQTTMLNFITTQVESSPAKNNNPNLTLFNEDNFSPIKSRRTALNRSPLKTLDQNLTNRLAEKPAVENYVEFDTPSKDPETDKENIRPSNRQQSRNRLFSKSVEAPLVENYFGFDTPNEKNKENARPKSRKDACPTRVSLTAVKEIQKEAVEKLLKDVNFDEEFELSQQAPQGESKEIPEDVAFVGLFEELETAEQPPKTYKRKRPRRVRIVSVDHEEEQDERPKKKKKDVRTPAEEAEFKKWVNAFNSMCKEVEKHELELA